MQKVPTKHRALGRSKPELATILSLLGDPVPSVDPPVPPSNNGNGAGGGAQPSTSPNTPTSTAPNSMGSAGDRDWSTPTSTSSLTGGGGTTVSPGSIVSSSTSGGPSSSSSSGSSSIASSSSTSSVGNDLGGGQSTTVNAEPGSSTATSAALGTSTSVAPAAGSPSPSQYLPVSGSNIVGADSSSPTATTSAAVSSGKHLSTGAIAGIAIVCLFFLLSLVLVVVRRHSIAGRVKLRRQWWFGHQASRGNFSLDNNNGSLRSPVASARSSFVTNFDQGLMPRAEPPSRVSLGVVPNLPPIAEVRERNPILISTGGAMARRESMNSMLSNSSEPDAQYLIVSGHDNSEPSWPMSVRPFSPSESFAFPKPPAPLSSAADPFLFPGAQGPSSAPSPATLVHLSTPSRAFMTDLPPAPVTAPSLYAKPSTSDVSLPPLVAAANPSVDPFADSEKPEFADIEVIRHAFNPSLNDELAVRPGDSVRVLQSFDDGWVSIEKLASTDRGRHERGLIPVACLSETSQALPTFPTQKRVSNYESDQLVAIAL